MTRLIDQDARDRFAQVFDRNFSVLAPAGVGKTTAIVARITELAAQARHRPDGLRHLVVVTYTRAAAEEMYQRAKYELVASGGGPRGLGELRTAFFGTLHSFCLRLIQLHGWRLNLPSDLSLEADESAHWDAFLREVVGLLEPLPAPLRAPFAALGGVPLVFALTPRLPADVRIRPGDPLQALAALPPPPRLDPSPLRALLGGRGLANQQRHLAALTAWATRWDDLCAGADRLPEDVDSLPLPEVDSGGKAFESAAADLLRPLQRWLEEVVLQLSLALARRYQAYKLARAVATFDDLIFLAFQLLGDEACRRDIRREGFSVLLDEAQDTDPLQFRILTEITRPEDAEGCWADGAPIGPVPGRFCMVGDPQQSIYGERADLEFYRHLHARLVHDAGGEELRLQVTMRCQAAVVDQLNRFLPHVLAGDGSAAGQVAYIPLEAKPSARAGQVVRIPLPLPPEDRDEAERLYPETVVDAIRHLGLDHWQARDWSQVAVLCARNDWLPPLARALRRQRLPVQLLTTRLQRRDEAAWAWGVAALEVLAHPENAYEVYGLLREVLGFSDDAIASYVRQVGTEEAIHPLALTCPSFAVGHPVGQALAHLAQVWQALAEAPLYLRVRQWLTALDLEARLVALPDREAGEARAALQALLRQAAEAEGLRQDLASWVAERRLWVETAAVEAGAQQDAWNLLTCHKSKGLGWDAVIVPHFFTSIKYPPPSYPRALVHPIRGLEVALTSSSKPPIWADELRVRRDHELDRLLYVACTRARQTLAWVDDASWMSKGKGKHSLAERLRVLEGDPNQARWLALPTQLQADAAATPAPELARPPEVVPPVALPDLATTRAGCLGAWRRVVPSSLAIHPPYEETRRELALGHDFDQEARPVLPVAPLHDPSAYGVWWHETMEHTPWGEPPELWQLHWQNRLEACPDPDRGRMELAGLAGTEPMQALAARRRVVRTEVPFLHPAPDQVALEGIMDFLAVLEDPLTWWLVDWKTDKPTPGMSLEASLVACYGPQIAAYRQALAALAPAGAQLRVNLYATREARWISLA